MRWYLFLLPCFLWANESSQDHILGIGASTIDLLIQVDEEFIATHVTQRNGGSTRGDPQMISTVIEASGQTPKIVPGGSVANTIRAFAKLGEKCAFFSHAGTDRWGDHFCDHLKDIGVLPRVQQSPSYHTSQVLCLITPSGQRTFLAYDDDLDLPPSPSDFKGVAWVHIEARRLRNGSCVEEAMRLACSLGAKVSIDLSSFQIVEEYRDVLWDLIDNYVDIVFCNEDEIYALTGLPAREGCLMLQERCPMAVVTLGPMGCVVGHQGSMIVSPAYPAHVVDTTGAGDLFVTGFLYGYLKNYPLTTCAKMGNCLGAAVTEHVGAELPEEKWESIRSMFRDQAPESLISEDG